MPIIPLLAAMLALDSLFFVWARLLLPYISPALSSFYYMVIATLEMLIYGLVTRRLRLSILRRHLLLLLAIGFFVAVAVALAYDAVRFIDPGTASMLSQVGVLLSLGFGLFWLRERLNPRQIAGALVAVVGVFVITFTPGELTRLGALLVLASNTAYSLHAVLTKRYAGDINLVNFLTFRLLTTAVFLGIFAAARTSLTLPTPAALLLLILAATSDITVSRALYYAALRRLQLSIHTVILTLSPVLTILWSLLLFGTLPTLTQFLGGLLIIAGVLLTTLKSRLPEPPPPLPLPPA